MREFVTVVSMMLVILYMFFGIDDLVWDVVTLFRRAVYRKNLVDFSQLKKTPPKMLAMMIAAWHESNVIEAVVSNIIESTIYPKSMYHIFVGVYPNDSGTIESVKRLEEKYENVHMIINEIEGPTSKAQNLNYVIRQIKKYEEEYGIHFMSMTVHDSEDVVHPYELLMTNHLIEKYDALQFPIFPIMRMPKFSNFFSTLTTSTYADEFAENHFSTMVGRYSTGGFVPCAGTGFALSRKTIDSFGDEDILPSESLTEDYRLSLTLYERGIQMYYVLEKLPRVTQNGKVRWEFISTRSLFPKTFKAAVRQKTRWIYGITMQTLSFKDIFAKNGMSLYGRYTLYKDLKAKYGNLVVLVGYPIFLYGLISLFVDIPQIYVPGTIAYIGCLIVTAMMIIRQIYRGISIYHVYGMRSVFFSCLLPPLFPIRLAYGNIINLVATIRAYKQKFALSNSAKKRQKVEKIENKKSPESKKKEIKSEPKKKQQEKWDKTDHEFLEVKALERYYRTIGDTLIMRGWITTKQVINAIDKSKEEGCRLGQYLVKNDLISEKQLMEALIDVQRTVYISDALAHKMEVSEVISRYDIELLKENKVLPIMKEKDTLILAICEESSPSAVTIMKEKYKETVCSVLMSRKCIENKLEKDKDVSKEGNFLDILKALHENGKITYEQLILVGNYCLEHDKTEVEMLTYMGLPNN
ncbi:MAG: phage adsorption protein NrfB [Lachnospiraceae bacterium]|nr:phage adsorption protein NrfB [Lachnospiraceae bacterium]